MELKRLPKPIMLEVIPMAKCKKKGGGGKK
jgi:hypothetical protein